MDRHQWATRRGAASSADTLSRRALLKGAVATGFGVAAGAGPLLAPSNACADAMPTDWQSFDRDVQMAMSTFGMVGAAVAVVNGAGVLHQQTFGVRDRASGAAVTSDTLFRVGSATKSMTSLLVASFVDQGLLDWDQPVVKVWPAFHAPTPALTEGLRVRDLMGMDSGLGEGPLAFHYDASTAIQLMQAVAVLQVRTPPFTEWYYNNVVYAAGGYLPLLAKRVPAEELYPAYVEAMQERVFVPIGMSGARIGNDPRPFTDNYAMGYGADFVEGTAALNWIPIGCISPAGAVLASVADMAAFVRTQLRGGVSPTGARVVSVRNLEQCWRPHIPVPLNPLDGQDIESQGYGMGWIDYTYKGGRRLIWHTGFWDGFGAFIGFFPEEDLGLAIVTNMSVGSSNFFYKYVLNLLLSETFGINRELNAKVIAGYRDAAKSLADMAAQSIAADAGTIAPFLGYYQRGYRLAFDAAGVLRLYLSAAADRVRRMADGNYVLASGQSAGTVIRLARDSVGVPEMTLEGFETVRWLSGPP
jgi:CubicO group peptidase (beta-lactamase class C family)